MKILIAEDEAIIAISLYSVLKDLNYEPLEPTASVEEALAVLESDTIDMAILDIHLGEYYSGFNVAKKLNNLDIPFIFLTALFDKETINKAKEYLPAAYIVKPFNKENLFATLELAIAQSKSTKENKHSQNIVFVKDGNKLIKVDTAEVTFLASEDKYIFIHSKQQKKVMVRGSFQEVVAQMKMISLIQVHKSYYVNINCITALKHDAIYINDVLIPIGRMFKENLQSFLER